MILRRARFVITAICASHAFAPRSLRLDSQQRLVWNAIFPSLLGLFLAYGTHPVACVVCPRFPDELKAAIAEACFFLFPLKCSLPWSHFRTKHPSRDGGKLAVVVVECGGTQDSANTYIMISIQSKSPKTEPIRARSEFICHKDKNALRIRSNNEPKYVAETL